MLVPDYISDEASAQKGVATVAVANPLAGRCRAITAPLTALTVPIIARPLIAPLTAPRAGPLQKNALPVCLGMTVLSLIVGYLVGR